VSYGLIVQPDSRLAVWSSHVDALVLWDATDEEYTEWCLEVAAGRERQAAAWAITRAREGMGPRTLPTYERAVAETRRRFPESAP
jgi:hypothetical protein